MSEHLIFIFFLIVYLKACEYIQILGQEKNERHLKTGLTRGNTEVEVSEHDTEKKYFQNQIPTSQN